MHARTRACGHAHTHACTWPRCMHVRMHAVTHAQSVSLRVWQVLHSCYTAASTLDCPPFAAMASQSSQQAPDTSSEPTAGSAVVQTTAAPPLTNSGAGAAAAAAYEGTGPADSAPLSMLLSAPAEKREEGAQGGQEELCTFVSCVFDCGPPRPLPQCTNTGTHNNPRWMCKPCNGARKAIELMASKERQTKLNLVTLKAADPQQWKQKVRAARIRFPGEACGVGTVSERSNLIYCATNSLRQSLSVQDSQKRKFLDKEGYMCYLKYKRNVAVVSPEQEDQLWAAALADPDILKEGSGNTTTVLVHAGHTLKGIRERCLSADVSRAVGCDSEQAVQDSIAKMSALGAGQGALSGAIFGQASAAFRPGSAASSSGIDSISLSVFGQNPAAAPATSILAVEDFAPFGTASGGNKRGLAAVTSDPPNPNGEGKMRMEKKQRSSGVTGAVAEAQIVVREQIKELRQTYVSGKNHLGKQVDTLAAKEPSLVNIEQMSQSCRYCDIIFELTTLMGKMSTWTVTCAQRAKDEVNEYAQELESLSTGLIDCLAYGKDKLKATRTAAGQAFRTIVADRERIVKPYLSKGSPAV
jgi:hypothetical protein